MDEAAKAAARTRRGTARLARVLADRAAPPSVRGQCAEALAMLFERADRRRVGWRAAVEGLLAGVEEPEPEVRFWCAFALGPLRAPRAGP